MISEFFMLHGSFYGLKLMKMENDAFKPMKTMLDEIYKKKKEALMSYVEPVNMGDFLLLKLIW